jgi:hypothetical protein
MTYLPALFPPYRPERLLFAVREAASRADWRQMARLPGRLHRGDPYWTAPARRLRFRAWIPVGDAIGNGNEIGLFLAETRNGVLGNEVVGSVAVWPDGRDESTVMRFGQFEVINEPEVAQVLLEAAEMWVRERYPAAVLRGPYALDGKRPPGLLVDGFNMPSGNALPYNPPYYPELLSGAEYEPWRTAYSFALPATSFASPPPERRTWPRTNRRTMQSPIAPDAAGIAALPQDRAWLIAPIWEDNEESLRVLMTSGARRLQTYQVYTKAL